MSIAEVLLRLGDALLGQDRGARLLVHEIVAGRELVAVLVLLLGAFREVRDDAVTAVVDVGVLFRGARDDERRAGLVDEDRVDLVDDRVDVAPLDHALELELHVVAQVVEAELVVRPVGDVAGVGLLALVVEEAVLDAADRQAEEAVDLAHPVGVAAGQVVVDGHDVHAPAGQGVQVDRHGRDERLALARLHLGDLALVEDHAADQLHVEGAHAQRAHGSFAGHGEGLLEDLVEDRVAGGLEVVDGLFAVLMDADALEGFRDPRPELACLRPEGLVRELLDPGLEGVDPGHARGELLEVALVLRAENFGEDAVDHVWRLTPEGREFISDGRASRGRGGTRGREARARD